MRELCRQLEPEHRGCGQIKIPNIAVNHPVLGVIERARGGNVRKINTAVSGTSANHWKRVPSSGGSFEIQ